MKIVQIDKVEIFPEDRKKLEKYGKFENFSDVPSEKEGIIRLHDADVVIDNWFEMPAPVINSAKKLKMIAVAATGYEWVDIKEAKKRSIVVCNSPGFSTEAVAEHTIGLLLNVIRQSSRGENDLKNKKYNPIEYVGQELNGKTLGIVGYGKIGKRVGEIAEKGFGMKILSINSSTAKNDWEDILKNSDVISINAPLNDSTRGMIGEREFTWMKNGVIVINTGRGAIINENVLIKNLKSKKVSAAGLDVLKDEPMDLNSPLLSFPNVLITPHIAFNTKESIARLSKIVTDNIINFFEGHPTNVVS